MPEQAPGPMPTGEEAAPPVQAQQAIAELAKHFMVPIGPDAARGYESMIHQMAGAAPEGEAPKSGKAQNPATFHAVEDLIQSLGEHHRPGVEKVAQNLALQAKGLYPAFAEQIDQGLTPHTLTEPYRQVAKQVLGNQANPDFVSDPKWIKALQGFMDEKTNRMAPMPLHEWRRTLMSDRQYGWEYTRNAHDIINRVMQELGQEMGLKPRGQ